MELSIKQYQNQGVIKKYRDWSFIYLKLPKKVHEQVIELVIDFNGMSACLGLFYSNRLGNCV